MKNLFLWNNVGFEVAEVFMRAQVMLSDVQMPDMDGLTLCRILESRRH